MIVIGLTGFSDNASTPGGPLAMLVKRIAAKTSRIITEIATAVPRLAPYPGRFAAAIERVKSGDHTFFLRPVIDSYHTIWFELHEELMGLAGLTRVQEAAAGRAE